MDAIQIQFDNAVCKLPKSMGIFGKMPAMDHIPQSLRVGVPDLKPGIDLIPTDLSGIKLMRKRRVSGCTNAFM